MIEKIKAKWALYKEAWPLIRDPDRVLYLRDLTDAQRELISVYDAKAWESKVVQSLKQELDARKAAMDEEEQAHEAAEEELRAELDKCGDALGGTIKENKHLRVDVAELTQQVADLKSRLAAALAEKACLLAEKAEWLKEGDPDRVPSETTPSDC